MESKIYNQKAEEAGKIDLPESVFNLPWNSDLVHQVVTAMQANIRSPWAHTKTRGEVSGGGRKPWRQKGLGRARHGSIRSPQWVGGGIAHGPKPRDFTQRTPKKMKRLALRSALSARASEAAVKVIEGIDWTAPMTKQAVSLLQAVG